MLLTIKIIAFVLFVVTGGTAFAERGRRHLILVALAGLVSLVGAGYLGRDIYKDLRSEPRQEAVSSSEKRSAPPTGNESVVSIEPEQSTRELVEEFRRARKELAEQMQAATQHRQEEEKARPPTKTMIEEPTRPRATNEPTRTPHGASQQAALPAKDERSVVIEIRPAGVMIAARNAWPDGQGGDLQRAYSEEASQQVAAILKSRGVRVSSKGIDNADVVVTVTGRGQPNPGGNAPGASPGPAFSEVILDARWVADKTAYRPLHELGGRGSAQVAFSEHMDDSHVIRRLIQSAVKELEGNLPALQR